MCRITVFSRNEIINYLAEGKLEITPFDQNQVGPIQVSNPWHIIEQR